MSTTNTKESIDFTPMYQGFVLGTKAGLEEFNQALDEMGVDNIIDAENDSLLDSGILIHDVPRLGVSFHAYAYTSPPGSLQIWMEATTKEPVVHAICRFSWNPQGQSAEQIAVHELRVGRIRHAVELRSESK